MPEVYQKVVLASSLLESGEAANTSEAVKLAGISRSVYYKYKDAVFPYIKKENTGILTVQFILVDRPGVLVSLLTVFYEAGANILTVNQKYPGKRQSFCLCFSQNRTNVSDPGCAFGTAKGSKRGR